jgi:hypothetical protein
MTQDFDPTLKSHKRDIRPNNGQKAEEEIEEDPFVSADYFR